MFDDLYIEKDLKNIKGFKLKYFQHLCKIMMNHTLQIDELILKESSTFEDGFTNVEKYFHGKCGGYQFIINYEQYINWTKEYPIKKFFNEMYK